MGAVFSSESSEEKENKREMALEKAKQIVSSSPVAVFSKSYCPYCTQVKELLSSLGANYKAVELDHESDGSKIQAALDQWMGPGTVRNVFIGGIHIGDCDSTVALDNQQMSDSTTSKMITLKSSDGVLFVVPETMAKQSKTICHVIEDISTFTFIPLPNVCALTLAMVIKYCKKHDEAADASKTETTEDGSSPMPASSRIFDDELRNWDEQFIDVDQKKLFKLMMAADYLHIQGLLDVACQKVTNIIKGKRFTPNEVKVICQILSQILSIKNDFTPNEKEEFAVKTFWRLSDENWQLYCFKLVQYCLSTDGFSFEDD